MVGSGCTPVMLQWERQAVSDYFQDITDDVGEMAESFRSAFLPLYCKPVGGKLYRKGDVVAATQGDSEVFIKIQSFFLVHVDNSYQHVLFGDTFQVVVGPDNRTLEQHPVLRYVQHTEWNERFRQTSLQRAERVEVLSKQKEQEWDGDKSAMSRWLEVLSKTKQDLRSKSNVWALWGRLLLDW